MEILGRLFGSEAKVKIIRLFLFNPETVFESKDISSRVKESSIKIRSELSNLERIEFIKRKTKTKSKKGFILNKNFSYLNPLQNLLINSKPLQPKEIIRKVSSLGNVKLIIVAGVFIQDPDSRVDILIAGDSIKVGPVEKMMKKLESEIGKELKYSYFSTQEFNYRLNMYDKLIRDVLDYPHIILVNKLATL